MYKVEDKETGTEFDIDNKYIMSPKDLCTIDFMDKIIASGVKVFKIEGRARAAEYVKRCASCYSRAAQAVCDGTYTQDLAKELKNELSEVFNRGFWDGYYQGAKLGEWSKVYGSEATRKKVYSGKVTNWFDKISVAEILVESASLKLGQDIIVLGSKTGVVEKKIDELRVDLEKAEECTKGQYCSIAFPGENLRRGDKVYIWEEVARKKI